jgi:tetratricopeptide (TPR) repeat protein
MQERLEESGRIFEKALGLAPGNQDLRRNLAANQLRLGRFAAAASNLETILRTNPRDREAILMLGFVRAREQKYTQAITWLEQVPDLVRQDPDHTAALARSYYGIDQKQKARACLTEMRRFSSNPAAFYLGGQVAMEASDWEIAERLFVAAKNAAHPRPVLVQYQLARIRYQTGRYRESRELLEPIANSPASDGAVLNLLAWCYVKEGDEATGVKILSFATDRFPSEAANFLDLGRLHLQRNRLDPALDVVRRGAARHPGSGPLFELKGELESAQGLHGPSVQSFRQAVRLNPRSRDALLGLALAQTNLLQHKDAVATFEKCLKLFPSDARFYAEYGKVLLLPWASGESPGAAEKAERMLRRAVQLDGSQAAARFELGNQLVKTGRTAEAVPHLEKAASLDPRNAQAHFVLARAYRALGRTQDAEREMQLFEKLR